MRLLNEEIELYDKKRYAIAKQEAMSYNEE